MASVPKCIRSDLNTSLGAACLLLPASAGACPSAESAGAAERAKPSPEYSAPGHCVAVSLWLGPMAAPWSPEGLWL